MAEGTIAYVATSVVTQKVTTPPTISDADIYCSHCKQLLSSPHSVYTCIECGAYSCYIHSLMGRCMDCWYEYEERLR